ncbi:CDP-diacylglycerol--glycerol-3-phosphate 3-phosphatidyltransferase [Malacoplasma iowae]|uniref:CDP-diacylglycerol--glycerol-3-phosphate 3-phosphatidyltransferase n=1 Tax=Malacoplasma iowae TaxID=2116 RepID=UPI002A18832A|nr:CDP-diacylglycerol--glycerol-3-phosphate 3-phosphatidyltransferase [Malacoplasma iowae]WPL38541.1 CDP-diacylglycerol--glycerol-3-phosphate 3-phosphatidyltransferase [Malacoplasma iowae]WPL39427.1 CDP-diacylglycerol--glycerol-3-phosphate 3-phosphatidyltransferase [Malacoplasma iowae]
MDQLISNNNKIHKLFKINNIPNILTVFRILFIPLILVFLALDSNVIIYSFKISSINYQISLYDLLAGIFFILACTTDALDGYLARKFNWISDFGKIWDPIADKVLTTSTFILLASQNITLWYLIVIMVSRDTIVDAYRLTVAKKNIVVAANLFGKLKTIFQMFSLIILIIVFNNPIGLYSNDNLWQYYLVQNILVFICTILSVISGIIYIVQINNKIKLLKQQEENYDKQENN